MDIDLKKIIEYCKSRTEDDFCVFDESPMLDDCCKCMFFEYIPCNFELNEIEEAYKLMEKEMDMLV